METSKKHLILVAGEASGDMHAAHLVEAVKQLDSNITFSGLGGPKMQANGVEIYQDLTQHALIGFTEVIKHFTEVKKAFNLILDKIRETKPAAIILIDYPGFNLRLARELKKMDAKVIYYISPQVWAWKKNRVYQIKKYVNKMLVLFRFEVDFYAQFGVDVKFVGHPLLDTLKVKIPREQILTSLDLRTDKVTIGLLPGSREREVQTLLPIILKAAAILHQKIPDTQFLLVKAPTIPKALIEEHTQKSSLPLKVIEQENYDGMNACDLCIVASGTATLETAILQKPMVVVYKTSFLTWVLAKLFIKIPNIGLVNVVAGKKIVPECVQFQATASQIAEELKNILTDTQRIAQIKSELMKVKESLGNGGASQRAAEEILKIIGVRPQV